MKRHHSQIIAGLALFVILGMLGAGGVAAQSGGYALDWFSVDGGGGQSSGGAYTLNGGIGQPDAGVLAGGAYTISGGFLQAGGAMQPANQRVYLPLVLG